MIGSALTGKERKAGEVRMNSNNDILSVLYGQNIAIINAFNPETLAFRNKIIELQKNCPVVEWERDMGATVPYCKLYKALCNGQCSFRIDKCPCDMERQ